jgi:hypothetical protein
VIIGKAKVPNPPMEPLMPIARPLRFNEKVAFKIAAASGW